MTTWIERTYEHYARKSAPVFGFPTGFYSPWINLNHTSILNAHVSQREMSQTWEVTVCASFLGSVYFFFFLQLLHALFFLDTEDFVEKITQISLVNRLIGQFPEEKLLLVSFFLCFDRITKVYRLWPKAAFTLPWASD